MNNVAVVSRRGWFGMGLIFRNSSEAVIETSQNYLWSHRLVVTKG